MMTTDKKTLGLYIHIPFCKQKCAYCDFCSVAGENEELKGKYVLALCDLIEKWSGYEKAGDIYSYTVLCAEVPLL